MRTISSVLTLTLLTAGLGLAQSEEGFSGSWQLDPTRSEVKTLPTAPDAFLKIEQRSTTLTIAPGTQETSLAAPYTYLLDGSETTRRAGDTTMTTVTKWEGSALLVNTLVSGSQNYTLMERWSKSRSGDRLTVKKTIVRRGMESESVLVYTRPGATSTTTAKLVERPTLITPTAPPVAVEPTEYVVEKGTRVLLRLTNAVNTKRTAAGDRVYLETAAPVFIDQRLIIPRGSYVIGTVVESHQAGRVKGKSALTLRFDSLTLPNGVARDLRSRPGSVDAAGNLDRSEGRIEGEGNKGGDAKTVGQTAATGAGIGSLAGISSGHSGMGAGIGAAAGAAAGLAGVLGSRGPQVVLPAGTSMELVIDRDLRFTAADLRPGVQ